MDKYVFIISYRGDRTNICSGFELISLSTLIEYIKEDVKTVEENKDKNWQERKETHFLDSYRKSIRVGKIDSKNFQTRILKYITLQEFEEIFKGHIEDIKPLLEYKTYGDKYFRSEVLKKYGIKKD